MTLKEELEKIHKEMEALEERERHLYKRSLEEEEVNKLCDDRWAEEMSEPEKGKLTFPITVSGISFHSDVEPYIPNSHENFLVKIRPCADEYEDKTFVGIHVGSFAMGQRVGQSSRSEILHVTMSHHNPAIFVPELNRVIFGYESWWGEIKSVEELKEITDDDIENVWYVKLLKERLG